MKSTPLLISNPSKRAHSTETTLIPDSCSVDVVLLGECVDMVLVLTNKPIVQKITVVIIMYFDVFSLF